ncbi:MAG: response regulator [Pseudomonadales bacterium]|nr:response regulator [Pseudomonadales bacterium]
MAEQTETQKALERQNKLYAMYRRCKVLIIEDSAQARGMLRGMLRDLTVEHIDMAMSGQDGIEHLRRVQYDIVLCDYNLGKGKDGQQVLEEARFGKYLKYSTVFIMITAETSVEMVMGALEYQPDSYLSKPFTRNELKLRLDRAMQAKIEFRTIDAAFEKAQYEEAIGLCQTRIEAEPTPQMRARRVMAESLVKLERYEEARDIYAAVAAERGLPWALIGLGKTAHFLGNNDDANRRFRKLIQAHPNVVESYDWLARVLVAQDRAREAQDVLEEACARSPKAVLRQMELARLALSNRSYLVAEKAYRKAIVLANDSCYRSPENFLQYVRTLLVKIEGQQGKLAREAFNEALTFIGRMRKEFEGNQLVDFRATMLEGLVLHYGGKSTESQVAVSRAITRYDSLNERVQEAFADEYVTTLALVGNISQSRTVLSMLVKRGVRDELITHLSSRIELGLRRLNSEKLNREALALYERGQILEAHKAFTAAASASGASANLLLNAVTVCLELAERQDLNQEDWRRECETYLNRLKELDQCDHRYEHYESLCQRFSQLSAAA